MINENILDPVQNKLNPNIWNSDKKLKRNVKIYIIKPLEVWLKNFTNKQYRKLYFLGSNAGYQYNDSSDIDINIEIDIPQELKTKISKSLPNGHLLPGTKHPINYYMTGKKDAGWTANTNYYDILNDKWIKISKTISLEPVYSYKAVSEIARFFVAGFDALLSEYRSDVIAYNIYSKTLKNSLSNEDKETINTLLRFKVDEILSDIDGIAIAEHLLKALRKEAFKKNKFIDISTKIIIKDKANFSINNIIYKYLEKLKYSDRVLNIINKKEKWQKTRDSL